MIQSRHKGSGSSFSFNAEAPNLLSFLQDLHNPLLLAKGRNRDLFEGERVSGDASDRRALVLLKQCCPSRAKVMSHICGRDGRRVDNDGSYILAEADGAAC